MGSIAENNQYLQGKSKILDEYKSKHSALRSEVAGRNFSHEPGFLYEASTMLELGSKLSLSELNYKITAEAIQRELTQTGFDYDIAYKDARVAFELEKQTLLTDLQQEFADLKFTQALSEEELDRLFVELEIRKLILITTKTEIALEAEGLKQDLERTRRLTMDKEIELINQKVITANKKLEVIPYIEALIDAEGRVLAAEEANIPYLNDLIAEKQLLAAKKLEVVPYLIQKADKLQELAAALIAEIDIKRQILAIALLKALLATEKTDRDIAIIEADKASEALRLLLVQAKIVLRHLNIDWDIDLVAQTIADINELSEDNRLTAEALNNYTIEVSSSDMDATGERERLRLEKREEGTDIDVDSDVSTIYSKQFYGDLEDFRKANIISTADITTKLIHILGSE